MPVAIVSGSGGLIGSESVEHLVEEGFDVIGRENDMGGFGIGAVRQEIYDVTLEGGTAEAAAP
jgi:CDP-paratose 2-epimerase